MGSIWPNAQLLEGDALRGSASALAIGSGQVRNLVNPGSGSYGETLLRSSNLLNSETTVRMNVLSNLLGLCGGVETAQACDELLSLTGSDNTLSALTSIARQPWKNVSQLYKLFDQSYRLTRPLSCAPRQPCPTCCSGKLSLSLVFNGGGAGLEVFTEKEACGVEPIGCRALNPAWSTTGEASPLWPRWHTTLTSDWRLQRPRH